MLTKYEEEETTTKSGELTDRIKAVERFIRWYIEIKGLTRHMPLKAYKVRQSEPYSRIAIFHEYNITINHIPGIEELEIMGVTDEEFMYLVNEKLIR